jgi:phage terminase Nu1 subunit (DNA packaging protein)
MSLLNIAEYARLTGWGRSTVSKKLSDMEYTDGQHSQKLYESKLALPILFSLATAGDLDLQAERARLSYHQANKAALEEREVAGELANMGKVEEEWIKMVAAFRAKLLGTPVKMAAELVGIEDRNEIKTLCQGHIEDALMELTAYGEDDLKLTEEKPKARSSALGNRIASRAVKKRSPKARAPAKANGESVG